MFHVEQYMNSHKLILLFIPIAVLILTGCRSENPNPELSDPIYMDLSKERDIYGKMLEDEQKKLEAAHKNLGKTAVRTIDRRTALDEIEKYNNNITRFTQLYEYYKIRAERRRVEGRAAYKRAFADEKEWPNPQEYQNYKIHKSLAEASLSWNSRVPKSSQNSGDLTPKPTGGEGEPGADAGAAPSGH